MKVQIVSYKRNKKTTDVRQAALDSFKMQARGIAHDRHVGFEFGQFGPIAKLFNLERRIEFLTSPLSRSQRKNVGHTRGAKVANVTLTNRATPDHDRTLNFIPRLQLDPRLAQPSFLKWRGAVFIDRHHLGMIAQEMQDLVKREYFSGPVELCEDRSEKLEVCRIVERHAQSGLTMKLVLNRQIVDFEKIGVSEVTPPNFSIRLIFNLDDLAKRLRLHTITERAVGQRQRADQIRVGLEIRLHDPIRVLRIGKRTISSDAQDVIEIECRSRLGESLHDIIFVAAKRGDTFRFGA